MTSTVCVGFHLNKDGTSTNTPIAFDWETIGNILIFANEGTPNCSEPEETQLVNLLLPQAIDQNAEIAICDFSGFDYYEWCRPAVRPHGWGSDSGEHFLATMRTLVDECNRRLNVIRQHRVGSYNELPASVKNNMPTIVTVIDSYDVFLTPSILGSEYQHKMSSMLQESVSKLIRHGKFANMQVIAVTKRYLPDSHAFLATLPFGARIQMDRLGDDSAQQKFLFGTIVDAPIIDKPVRFCSPRSTPVALAPASDWTWDELETAIPIIRLKEELNR